MDIGLEIKRREFDLYTRELARRTGVDLPRVIESEVAAILSKAASRTKRATAASIRKSEQNRGPWRTFEGQKLRLDWRHPNAKWQRIRAWQRERLRQKKQAAGLASSAWVDIARKLRLQIKAPARALKAHQPPGYKGLATVHRQQDPKRFFIVISHRARVLRYAHGDRALFGAIAGRIKFFERNLNMGVFKSAADTAKKYPGFSVTMR